MEYAVREPRMPRPRQPRPAARLPHPGRPLCLASFTTQPSPEHLLQLQRTLGNRATNALLSHIQASLTAGAAGDACEQEAERVADQVTRGMATADTAEIQTSRGCETAAGFDPGEAFEQRLVASQGDGQPLPAATRDFMEQRFGADFGDVRVHVGGEAAALNRAVSAQAFTHGSHVYLGEGTYGPGTAAGKRLLAHELTHVVQQTDGRPRRKVIRRFSSATLSPDQPIDWRGETTSVKRSGEGRNGGVFFFNSAGGVVVVKAIDADERNKVRMMEETLKAAQVRTVESKRVVPGDSDEASAIREQVASKLVVPEQLSGDEEATAAYRLEVQSVADRAGCFLVQPRIEGETLSSLLEGAARDQARMDALIAQLNNPTLLREIGRMLAVDAFTNFYDRMQTNLTESAAGTFSVFRAMVNTGNIMITGGNSAHAAAHAIAIDNAAGLQDLASAPVLASQQLEKLHAIIDQAPLWPQIFFEQGIFEQLRAESSAGFDALGYFRQHFDVEEAQRKMEQGLRLGLTRLTQLVAGGHGGRAGIKATASEQGGHFASWQGFKLTGAYLTARGQGHDHQQALAEALAYGQLRNGYVDWEARLRTAAAFDPRLSAVPQPPGRLDRLTAGGKQAGLKYDVAYQAFLQGVLGRTAVLGSLVADFEPLVQRGSENGPAAARARKLLGTVLRTWRNGSALGELYVAFITPYKSWAASLDAKDPRSAELCDAMRQLGNKIFALNTLVQRASAVVRACGEDEAAAAPPHHWTAAVTPPPNKPNT